jgi:transcriptional regulator with XRE-family HTH domain
MLSDELKAFKDRMDWTHTQCADRMNVEHSTWYCWLRGKFEPMGENRKHAMIILKLSQTTIGRAKLDRWAENRQLDIEEKKLGTRWR